MEGPPRKPPGASAKGGALLKGTDRVSIFFGLDRLQPQ
jgi:hypothetical protein